MANRLKALRITSVDLCAKGANPGAHIALMKSDEREALLKIAKAYLPLGVEEGELVNRLEAVSKGGAPARRAYLEALDECLRLQEAFGLFGEVGSNRSSEGEQAFSAAMARAKQAHPGLSYSETVVKAYEMNPGLSEIWE